MSNIINEELKQEAQRILNLESITSGYKYDIKISSYLTAGNESFCGPTASKSFHIEVSYKMVQALCDITGIKLTKELFLDFIKGINFHEIAHALYSDFNVVKENGLKLKFHKEIISTLVEPLVEAIKDKRVSIGDLNEAEIQALEILKENIYQYVRFKNLQLMLNSLEDAAIENAFVYSNPSSYGFIRKTRNLLYLSDKKATERHFLNDDADITSLTTLGINSKSQDYINTLISEIRQFSTIGYRKKVTPQILYNHFSKQEIDEIEALCLFARFNTKTTKERNIVSGMLLDKMDKLFQEKTEEFLAEYIMSLESLQDMDINDFLNNTNAAEDKELGINIKVPPSSAPSAQTNSQYEMDVPDSLQKEFDEKVEESKKEEEKKEKENSESDKSGDSDESKDSEDSSKEENSDSQDDSSSDASQTEGSENEDTSDKKDDNAGNCQSSLEDDEQNQDKALSDKRSIDEIINKELEDEDFSEKIDAKKSAKESFEKMKQNLKDDIKKMDIQSQEQGKAPKTNKSGTCSSNMHKGIRILYNGTKHYEDSVNEKRYQSLKNIITPFAKKLQEVLLYKQKNHVEKAKRRGKLNVGDLYRVKTDLKIFQKKIDGDKKNARICVLIDESGSMSGDKMRRAQDGSFIIASACAKIKVPIALLGHKDCGDNRIIINQYLDFGETKNNQLTRVFNGSAGGCNRDGMAIMSALSHLVNSAKPNEKLINIIISDGAPSSNDYYGESAERDIQQICEAFENQYKVQTIGIGIGSDTAHVKNIYKNYILVPNVSELGNELLKILEEIVS